MTMTRTGTNSILLLLAIMISLAFSIHDEQGKIHLKVTKEENGSKQVFEKQYNSMEELKADRKLKQFDVFVAEWTNDEGHDGFYKNRKSGGAKTIILKTKMDGKEMTWIWDDNENLPEDENQVIIRHKDGPTETIEYSKENVIRIKTGDRQEHVTMNIEGDSAQIEKSKKEIEIITADEEDGEIKVFVKEGYNNRPMEIEAKVQKEIDENGDEKIVGKKVWITKDGKKIELDKDDSYEFKTDGDNIIIKMDSESMESSDFSGGKFEGDNLMVFRNNVDRDSGLKQTMNINIDEKNGEQFIEIDIKRSKTANLMISDILKGDASLSNIDFALKNNLKPSQLTYYPNPNNGRFTLSFTLDQKDEVTVLVLDILGKEVYKEKLLDFEGDYDNQIDLSGKEKGIYILQIIQKKKMLTRKILIE